MKHIQGEFPIKSSWPKGWKFKDYPKRDDDSPPIVEEVKEIPSPDPLIKVRNFHKKYARIATPPDKSETTRYISSHKVPNKPVIEEPPPPIHKYIETEKGKLLDTMGKQAKKRAELRTINTITEFGELKVNVKARSN
uniref:Uncharacterized protein n=1 Tax=Euplotes crassus TaxID=5936 RepID=A0A7S3KW50_EUPCR|mmetsp:Transcript_8238/g.7824  ORF Transcript_8238/g.7824 Transcript_8238/m.7824 type:complete len:137 (+) Transcript_8238:116-526(+)